VLECAKAISVGISNIFYLTAYATITLLPLIYPKMTSLEYYDGNDQYINKVIKLL